MINEYATVVFPNGRIVSFRLRDHDYNRFKSCLICPSSASGPGNRLLVEFMEAYPDIDTDDCNGDELATLMRFVMNSLE